MSAAVEYSSNRASEAQIAEHLFRCDADFVPPLSGRVDIGGYAGKIAREAERFEAWSGRILIALVAIYCNDHQKGVAYITSVSVLREWMAHGIGARLISSCIAAAAAAGMREVRLEVGEGNTAARRLYEKSGFVAGKAGGRFVGMKLDLESRGRQ